MRRRYIGIEQLAYGENSAEVRLAKVIAGEQSGISTLSTVAWAGGGSFVSMSLLGRTEDFKSRVMSAKEADIDTLVEDMSAYSMYLDYRFRPEVLASPQFAALSLEQKRTVLMRALDKNNLYVNYSDVEDSGLTLTDADKALNHKFYGGK
jgi:adenine-specific DNA-methyltransferase